jgi:hypothetical protein
MDCATFPLQVRAEVERYLSGEISLEAAARQISSILGSSVLMRSPSVPSGTTGHVASGTVRIAPIPTEHVVGWLGLRTRAKPQLSEVALGLGGSWADQPKVRALFREVFGHLLVWHHVWRRFGRDAA